MRHATAVEGEGEEGGSVQSQLNAGTFRHSEQSRQAILHNFRNTCCLQSCAKLPQSELLPQNEPQPQQEQQGTGEGKGEGQDASDGLSVALGAHRQID